MHMQLTPEQKNILQKALALTVGAVLLVGCFLAAPTIATAIPSSFAAYLSAEPPIGVLAVLRAESMDAAPIVPHPPQSVPTPPEDSAPPVPEDAISVFADSFCWYEPDQPPTLDLINGTSFRADLQDYLQKRYPIAKPATGEPIVLIVHTHGSESYLPDGTDYYLPGEDFRSTDPTQTVIAAGEVIADALNALGITTVHDKTLHDTEDFNRAYLYTRKTIEAYLQEYPSILYILDVHRDSIETADGICSKTLTTIDGTPTAQVMLVVGTDQNGASHPDWQTNLTVATYLQNRMHELYPTLARPLNLRADAFNQWLSSGALLVEIGSCGNTVTEAKTAARLFAWAFASMI